MRGEHHDVIAGIEEALRLEVPFAPRFPEHGDHAKGALSPAKDRLPFGVVGRQANLELRVEIVAEYVVNLIRGNAEEIPRAYRLRIKSTFC
jgi:hypothetical protein